MFSKKVVVTRYGVNSGLVKYEIFRSLVLELTLTDEDSTHSTYCQTRLIRADVLDNHGFPMEILDDINSNTDQTLAGLLFST